MRIFLDANILFSAGKSDGAIRRLLDLLARSGTELVADPYVMHEAARNLAVKQPHKTEPRWDISTIVSVSATVPQHPLNPAIELAEKDRPVLAAAIALKCDVLLTGDRTHFGHLFGEQVEGVAIHSPRSLAETIWSA